MSRRGSHSDIFLAVADPTRRDILRLLRAGECPVTELAASFDMTLSAVSQHIRVLREAGLVEVRQAGRERRYRLNPAPLQEIADWAAHYERFWTERLDALGRYLAEEENEIKQEESHGEDNNKA